MVLLPEFLLLLTTLGFVSLTSRSRDYEWQWYVWKPVGDCLVQHRHIQDSVTMWGSLAMCHQKVWEEITNIRYLTNQTYHTIAQPYSHVVAAKIDMTTTTIALMVHHLFKVNLTVNKLDIKRSLTGCVHGQLQVSIQFDRKLDNITSKQTPFIG